MSTKTPKAFGLCTHPDVRGFDPYNHVNRDVWKRPNSFGVFLDMDLTHLSPSLPYALRSLGFDPSLSLLKLYKEPLGTLKAYRENWEKRNYSPLLPKLILESASLYPLEHFGVLPKLTFYLWACYREMEDWSGGGLSGGFSFSGSQTYRQRFYLVIFDLY